MTEPCITGTHHGRLTVAADRSLCIASGGVQDGSVTVRPGGALAVLDADVHGSLTADGALALTVCHSTLRGSVTVHGTGGRLLIGSEAGRADGCAGNEIHGAVTLDAGTDAGTDGTGAVTSR